MFLCATGPSVWGHFNDLPYRMFPPPARLPRFRFGWSLAVCDSTGGIIFFVVRLPQTLPRAKMTSGGNRLIPRKLLVFMRKDGAAGKNRTYDPTLTKGVLYP